MQRVFLDTSALVKRYHEEVGTGFIDDLLSRSQTEAFISRLSVLEFHSAFVRKVRERLISEDDFHVARRRFLTDIAASAFSVVRLSDSHMQNAEQLLLDRAITASLRTLDALQLAAAFHVHEHVTLQSFVCADQALCRIVAATGLTVLNPEEP